MKKKKKWNQILRDMRLNIAVFVILLALIIFGRQIIRISLLENAQETGTALTRSYAAEERGNLEVYENLLAFGVATLDDLIDQGYTRPELMAWMERYFNRLQYILGEDVVTPYLILDGEVISVSGPVSVSGYDYTDSVWYEKTLEADGLTIFTDMYPDAVSGEPVVTASRKCRNSENMLVFDIFPENFRFQTDPPDIDQGLSFFLCDSQGDLLYYQTDMQAAQEEVQDYIWDLMEEIRAGTQAEYNDYFIDRDGQKRAAYYAAMENGWMTIITVPYSVILHDLTGFTLVLVLIFGVCLAALVVMTWKDIKSRARIARTDETVRVLGNSYYALYRINFGDNTYEMIKGSDYMRQRVPQKGNYEDLLQAMSEVIAPDTYDDYMSSFSRENIRALVSRRVRDFGGDFQRRFGDEYRWVSVRVLFDESLAPEEVVLCYREVDQEKQSQMRERKLLEDALEVAKKNEDAKQSFFRNMSHDMRTPLNAIIGLTQLGKKKFEKQEEVQNYLGRIENSSRQLLNLINDILDMSRMEQGKVGLNHEQFDLSQCISQCLDMFRVHAIQEHKQLKEEMHIENRQVLGDSFRLTQVMNNLLSNAFKFTSEGGSVSVEVTQIDRGEFSKYKIVVKDTGVGMSEEFLPHLFEPYAREVRFSARQTVGTGLGMPITKNLITQMNGEIQVDSQLGKGTVFTVVIPFQTAPEEENETEKSQGKGREFQLKGRHILLAEDNEINMEITTEMLTMNGVQVTQAWNGKEAVECFKKSEPYSFDAILMDMQMPEMDGCEAARRIRSMRRPDAQDIPILAVTANAFAEDIAATTAAGMNAHVSKPIDFKLLCRTLEQCLG